MCGGFSLLLAFTVDKGQGGILYKFNGLNELKPDMITETTRMRECRRIGLDGG
jgi:hypothetical protein